MKDPASESGFIFLLEDLHQLVFVKKKDTVASYVYFSAGMIFAATFIYPIPLFSIIGILCFADTAASLFGRKYGKHKLPFNKTKSWEGSIGGIIVCIIVTFLLVGPIWGLAATLVFFLIDAVTPTLPLSDNIGIPVAVTGVYLLLSVLQIPMYSILFFPFI
jgi:dolichol kinase